MEVLALIFSVISLIISAIVVYVVFAHTGFKQLENDKYKDFRDPETGLLKGKRK